MDTQLRSVASRRSQWWQGRPPWIWRSRITGDAIDHGDGGRETRLDLVVAGLAQHDPGDRRPLAVDPADRPEGEAADAVLDTPPIGGCS